MIASMESTEVHLNWSPTGWEAHYEDRPPMPIERWSDNGKPLVVSEEHQQLVPASMLAGFTGIDTCHRAVGFVPAEPGALDFHGRPIRAWMIDSDSFAYPVTEDL